MKKVLTGIMLGILLLLGIGLTGQQILQVTSNSLRPSANPNPITIERPEVTPRLHVQEDAPSSDTETEVADKTFDFSANDRPDLARKLDDEINLNGFSSNGDTDNVIISKEKTSSGKREIRLRNSQNHRRAVAETKSN